MTAFLVRPTNDRSDSRGEYLARMSLASAKRVFGVNIPRMIAVSYLHPKLANTEISALAWLRVNPKNQYFVGDDEIQLDQTIRQCLGLDFSDYKNEKVNVNRVFGVSRLRQVFSKIVGRRLICCRPGILQPLDIEKDIVRLRQDAIGPLGVASGDAVIISGISRKTDGTYWMNSRRVTVIAASDSYEEFYARMPNDRSMENRYTNIQTLLGQPDLHQLFLDLDSRNYLFGDIESQRSRITGSPSIEMTDLYLRTVQCAQPIVVYRAPIGALAHEIGNIGTIAAAALAFLVAVSSKESIIALTGISVSLLFSAFVGFVIAIIKTRTLWRS